MSEKNLFDEMIEYTKQNAPVNKEELMNFFHIPPHELHANIKEINLEQIIIIETPEGYVLNEVFQDNKKKSWRRIKTAVLYADYEHSERYTYEKLKRFENDIIITSVYHLYQPISSTRTEFIINASSFHSTMLVPYVMVSPAFDKSDLHAIQETIDEIKKQTF